MPAEQRTYTRPEAVTALREIARALNAAWDLDSTLDLIAQKTTEVMQVDSCSIYLLDPDGESLRLQGSTGLAKRAIGRATLQVGEGMTGYAVQKNKPIFAADAQHDPHFKWVEEANEMSFYSLLAVPLTNNSVVIGAMNVQTKESHHFNQEEIEIFIPHWGFSGWRVGQSPIIRPAAPANYRDAGPGRSERSRHLSPLFG